MPSIHVLLSIYWLVTILNHHYLIKSKYLLLPLIFRSFHLKLSLLKLLPAHSFKVLMHHLKIHLFIQYFILTHAFLFHLLEDLF